jgi:transcriptional regulator
MYLPAHFSQTDPATLSELMRKHPLAALVSTGEDGPTADHLPLEYDPQPTPDAPHGTLRGHVARANPLWRQAAGQPVLAIFRGETAYVSPNWYPSKAATHQVVPTWNYAVVHAHGPLRALEDAPWVHALVSRLTDHFETPQPQPWAVSDAPDAYVQTMLRAIVGIEIPVQRLLGKWKLSQNRNRADRQGVHDSLAQGDAAAQAAAALMRRLDEPR